MTSDNPSPPDAVQPHQLFSKLGAIFRKYGYDATSLSMIQEATGRSKGSIYHRFPNGKAQIVQELIASRGKWLHDGVLLPLRDGRAPATRVMEMLLFLDRHYEDGASTCLLGTLALSENAKLYQTELSRVFQDWIDALTVPLLESGMSTVEASALAQSVIIKVQGALLLARALGTKNPYLSAMAGIRAELLAATAASTAL